MARHIIDPADVRAAGENLRDRTANEVEQASEDSRTNTQNVLRASQEITQSKARVENFITGLQNGVKEGSDRVSGTDWQSPSRDRFETEVVRFTGELNTIGNRYSEAYDTVIEAVKNLETTVQDIDRDFDRVTNEAVPLLQNYGQTAIDHANTLDEQNTRGIQVG